MNIKAYRNLFDSFELAPLADFLKVILAGISDEDKKELVIVDLSYHQLNADNVLTLEAFFSISSIESDQWIWIQVEKDLETGKIQEYFYTKDSYLRDSLPSLKASIDYYKNRTKNGSY